MRKAAHNPVRLLQWAVPGVGEGGPVAPRGGERKRDHTAPRTQLGPRPAEGEGRCHWNHDSPGSRFVLNYKLQLLPIQKDAFKARLNGDATQIEENVKDTYY